MQTGRRRFLTYSATACLLARSGSLFAGVTDLGTVAKDALRSFPAYIDTLIPEDETPGGVALGVEKLVLAKAQGDADYQRLLILGCQWLDAQAQPHNTGEFAALAPAERGKIVTEAETSPPRSLARVFFKATRDDALFFYYSHPGSWPGLGFPGPPQPAGYMDFTQPMVWALQRR